MLAFFAAALVMFLASCGPARDSGGKDVPKLPEKTKGSGSSRPLPSMHSHGGETMAGALGTCCWSSDSGSICAAAVGVSVNDETLTVPASVTRSFACGGKKLDSLSISADQIGRGNHLEYMSDVSVLVPNAGDKGYRTIRLQTHRFGNRAHVAAELPAGKYTVAAFVRVS